MLEGKRVMCSEPERLIFFYPDFVFTSTLNEWSCSKNIIYNGNYYASLDNDLRMYARSYISLVGQPDIMIHTRKDWLDFAYAKTNKKVPKYVVETYESLDEEDFWFGIKGVWLTGRWTVPAIPSEKVFSLFEASRKSFVEILKQYFTLVDEYPLPYVEASFLTFLLRVKDAPDLSTETVSPKYLQVLKSANTRIGKKIVPAIDVYLQNEDRSEARFLQLLFNLFQ